MSRYFGNKARIVLLVLGGVGLVTAANWQLLEAAFTARPACVPHLQEKGAAGQFQAAQSSC